jgi:hypothetical protein
MKKILLGLCFVAVTLSSSAQFTPTRAWSYGARISLNDPYFAVAVDSKGEALVAGGGNATNYNFTIAKRDTAGASVYAKVFSSRNQGYGSSAIDAQDDLLVISAFAAVFELNTDTLTTAGVTDIHTFIGKFDGQTGNNIWIKSHPVAKPISSQFLDNGNILLQFNAGTGDFIFDGAVVTNHTVDSYIFLELDNASGQVVRHFSFNKLLFPALTHYRLDNNTLTYLTFGSGGQFNQFKYLIKHKFDLTTSTFIQSDSLPYFTQYNLLSRDFDEVAVWLDKQTNDVYMGVGHRTDYSVLGTDTIAKDHFALMHYDDNLNLKHRVDVQYGINSLYMEDTNLVASVLVPQFSPRSAFYGTDTIAAYNNVQAFMIVRSNPDHQNRSYAFMATDSWQTGLELRDVEVDAAGNVYVLGFHENDIIFSPYTSAAANRSWKHHSALGKLKFGQNSGGGIGLEEAAAVRIDVFPNPFAESLMLRSDDDFEYAVYNQQGVLVKQGAGKQEAVVDLPQAAPGLYFVKLWYETHTEVVKVIKQ